MKTITVCVSMLLVLVFVSAPRESSAVPHDTEIQQLANDLLRSRSTSAMSYYARAFTVYALVNMGLSEQSRRDSYIRLADRLIAQAQDVRIYKKFGPNSVAYTGHLVLMLEGRRRLGPLLENQKNVYERVSKEAAEQVLASPGHLLPTYGKRIWPADNEVLAVAFRLAQSSGIASPKVRQAAQVLTSRLQVLERGGLPPSEVDSNGQGLAVPRGCALSWTVAMRALEHATEGASLYQRYRKDFYVDRWGIAGFREWPPGQDGPEDADSGPIILGRGIAASGIGMAAAKLVGAKADERALWRTAGWASRIPSAAKTRQSYIARAMLLWARSARPWESQA